MDFGFIQAAAPATQPVPLTDAPASPGAAGDAAAFDAALAQTLAGGSAPAAGKAPVVPNTTRVQQPQWLPTTLFADSVAASASPAAAVVTGEEAAAEDDGTEVEPPVDEVATETATDVVVAVPVPVEAPVPVRVDTPVRIATPGASVPFGDAVAKKAPSTETAAAQVEPLDATPAPVEDGSPARSPRVAGRSASKDQGADAKPAADETVVAATPRALGTPALSGSNAAASATPGNGEGQSAPEAIVVPSEHARTPKAAGRVPDVQTPAPAAIAPAARIAERPATEIAASLAAAAASGAAIPATPATPAAGAELTDGPQAVETLMAGAAASSSGAGQDAPMTGRDESNGQSRQSHDFVRFAAALKQVSAADEGGRAPVPSVSAAATPEAAAAATPTAPVGPASAAPETPGPENVGRLVQAMRVIARPGAWEANVRLNPEHLGDVSIAVRVERNTVSAVVNAESAGVCEWLESQEQAVRNGMAEQGLQLDRFVVQRDGQRREAPEQEQQQGRRAPRGRQAAATERFEIVV